MNHTFGECDLIGSFDTTSNDADIMFKFREMLNARRQFAVAFHPDGTATISAPLVGHRSPANPQPTPPVTVAMRRAA